MAAQTGIQLTTPLSRIRGIGPAMAARLARLGPTNAGRLIAYLPMRHERTEAEGRIADIPEGQNVSVRGEISATRVVGRGRAPRFEAVLLDETGRLDLVWFNGLYLRNKIHVGMRVRAQGKARRFGYGMQLANPRFEILEEDEPERAGEQIRPIYPASEEMPSSRIEQAVRLVLEAALAHLEDHLSAEFRRERELPELRDAYRAMHAPRSLEEVDAARRRLAYDELLMLQLGVHIKRAHLRRAMKSPRLRWSEAIDRHIRARLPFTLTPGQEGVVKDLIKDLTRATPTNRLIQGDVGSGKTVVGLYAMLMAAATGHQAALMAPTELLAEQHYLSITSMLAGSDVRVELLTGTTPQAERASILERLARPTRGELGGGVDVLIGTHALLTQDVAFDSLGVAIIDEQHRFGVHQRAALRAKAGQKDSTPHVLVMTATPIPRTLAITLFGDLDVSTIRGLPPGRMPVTTRIVRPEREAEVYAHVRERLDRGEQAYIVAPAIDSPDGGVKDVRSLVARLEERELAGRRVAALHGRLKRSTREHIMGRFRAGLIDALVATTVIEVGVDVPDASVMVVVHAERFGLAQLHQLRGRVGRGNRRSVCLLIAEPATEEAAERLEALAKTSDGFALAEKDLELRGPGEVFGTRQWGLPPLRVADLMRDRELLALARRDAAAWIDRSPTLSDPSEALLRRRLWKTHGEALGLGDVG